MWGYGVKPHGRELGEEDRVVTGPYSSGWGKLEFLMSHKSVTYYHSVDSIPHKLILLV